MNSILQRIFSVEVRDLREYDRDRDQLIETVGDYKIERKFDSGISLDGRIIKEQRLLLGTL